MEHIGSLMATMGIDITQAEKNIAKIEKDVKQYAKVVETEFKKIEKEFNQSEKIFKKYADTIDKEINSVKKDLASLEKQYGSLATTTGSSLDKVESKVKKHSIAINALLKTVRAAVLGYATVLATTKIVDFTTGIIKAGVELDSFERALVAITKSQKQARYEFDFVNKVAQDYGLNLQALRQSYVGLLASSQKTNLVGEETRRLFVAISAAASVLGMSTDNAQGSLKAFVQMISKGTVQAEELRGQLGDRLYGAFNKAADAMGVSTSELNKMLKKGEVLASDLIPKLTRLLEGEFLEAAMEAGNGPRASFEKLNTSILNLQEAIANSGVLDNFVNLAQETTKWVKANEKLLAQDFRTVFDVITFGGKTALVVIGGLVNKFSQLNAVLGKIGDIAGIAFNGNDNAIDETKSRIKELQQALLNLYSGYNFVSKETQKQRDIEIAQIKRQIKIYEEVLSKFGNKEINLKVDASIGENFDEIDVLFKELVDKSRLAQDDIQKNTDKTLEKEITATRKALDKIIADRKKAYETLLKQQEKYREDISEYLDTYNLSDYDKKLYYLEKEVQAFKEVGLQEIDYAEYIAAKKQEIDNDYYEQQQKELDKLAKIQQEAYDDLYDTMKGYTRDVIDDFDGMGDTLVGIAENIAKDIAAAFLTQNIVMPITMAVGSSFGLTGSGGVPYSAMAGGGSAMAGGGGMDILSLLSNAKTGYSILSGGMSSSVEGFLSSGFANSIGSGLFGASAWGAAAAPTYLAGPTGAMLSVNSGLAGGVLSGGAGSASGIVAGLSTVAPYLALAGLAVPIISSFFESEPEPRIGIRKGDISDFGYNPTTKDMSNQKPINEYIVKYFDSYFSAIDELTSNSVKDVLENTKWERIRVHPDDFDSVEDAIFAVSDDVFNKFADGFIAGLADGQLAGYLDENFFGSIKTENENLLDSFIRFGIVLENTDDFVFQFTRQIDDFGTSTVQAFNNVSAITAIMGQVKVGIDSIANVSAITTLDNLTASWNDLILSLEAANATTEQLARTQTGMAKALGANLTGLTADTLQAALMSGGDIDSILTSSIQSASYTSIAQDIAETYINNLNEEIGRVWIDSGGNINDVISAMQSLDTTDVRNEIEQLKLSFGLLTDDIEEVSDVIPEVVPDVIPEVASITDSAEQELNAAQDAFYKAQDQYADAFDYKIDLLNDEIDQIQDEINLKKELIRENENLLDSFKYLKDGIVELQSDIVLSDSASNPQAQMSFAKARLEDVTQKLFSSNPETVQQALEDLPGISKDYIDISRDAMVNQQDQLSALGYVQSILNTANDVADVQIDKTESTIDRLYRQNEILIENQEYYKSQIELLSAIKQGGLNTNKEIGGLKALQNELFLETKEHNERQTALLSVISSGISNTNTAVIGLGIAQMEYKNVIQALLAAQDNYDAAIEDQNNGYNGTNIPAFASGGTVRAPTLAMIGEGGQAEHITPDSQMQGVKDRLDKVCDLMFALLNVNGDNKELLDDLIDVFVRNTQGQLPFKTEAA